ncbi:ead/Ea22-like family protein [Aeromicrobium sp. HA]|uniref:ead/Ea22-like family protein n=1 Tax=Aeromicrobium sp. HA TaxID=3009077 RepID=UPI0022AF4528|nr:ead/Ea22-like family protein [Aeromicrobium sp. HA]
MAELNLTELREVAEAATPGPWTWHEYRRSGDPLPYLVGRGGDPEFYVYDAEVIEPDHDGECGCRSACRLELRVRDVDQSHIATFDPPTVLALLDRVAELEAVVGRVEAVHRIWNNGSWGGYTDQVLADLRAALAGDGDE